MRIKGYLSRLTNEQPTLATTRRVIGCLGVAILFLAAVNAVAQQRRPLRPRRNPCPLRPATLRITPLMLVGA